MNIKYTVRFYNRNAQDEQDRNTIQRETFHGCNETDVREVYEDNGLEIVDIVETSKLVDTLYAKIDELNATIANLNEGAKIMHAFATGGESKLLEDWQIEAEAGDKKTDFNTPKPRIIVSQSWLDKHTNNGIDDLKPTFGKIEIIGGTRKT